jgi:hypothetical protein
MPPRHVAKSLGRPPALGSRPTALGWRKSTVMQFERTVSSAELAVTNIFRTRNTPGMTAIALTVALTTPHAGMPMFLLTADQSADIITYILSLR